MHWSGEWDRHSWLHASDSLEYWLLYNTHWVKLTAVETEYQLRPFLHSVFSSSLSYLYYRNASGKGALVSESHMHCCMLLIYHARIIIISVQTRNASFADRSTELNMLVIMGVPNRTMAVNIHVNFSQVEIIYIKLVIFCFSFTVVYTVVVPILLILNLQAAYCQILTDSLLSFHVAVTILYTG
jgi:hypothetical protein